MVTVEDFVTDVFGLRKRVLSGLDEYTPDHELHSMDDVVDFTFALVKHLSLRRSMYASPESLLGHLVRYWIRLDDDFDWDVQGVQVYRGMVMIPRKEYEELLELQNDFLDYD